MKTKSKNHLGLLLFVGAAFIVWGVLGLMDSKNYTYSGYQTDGNNTIVQIEDASPAAVAGLQIGDVIKSTGGIPVTDTKAQMARNRAEIGESREFIVDRNGEEVATSITYAELSSRDSMLNNLAFVMGILFIVMGIFTHYRKKTALSFTFAIFMLCFGFIFFNGPYIEPGFSERIISAVSITIVLFSFAALANYMLYYPPKSNYNVRWLYAPAILTALFFWGLELTLPDSTSTLNLVIRMVIGGVIIFYFALALYTLIRKYIKASAEERKVSGLNLMLIGALIGLLPILVYFTINTISPGTILPGNDYVFLTFIAIPVFFTLALLQEKTARVRVE